MSAAVRTLSRARSGADHGNRDPGGERRAARAGPNRVRGHMPDRDVLLFSTCPQSTDADGAEYRTRVVNAARWSERHGCGGMLVYSDNRLVDAWLVAQLILQHTERLCPLVAVQPAYLPPYAAAKMVASLGHLYGRRICLNLVAGGFRNDLLALNDGTPHDRRYVRLTEYTEIVTRLLAGNGPVTYQGEFYQITNLRLTPRLPPELMPGLFVSGSSPAGLEAARVLGATAVRYPRPADQDDGAGVDAGLGAGVRLGIIARERDDEAWDLALARFPESRKGQITRQLAARVSDSVWHGQLAELAERPVSERNPYWLVPFENYQTMCPYLVGNYERVGEEIARYLGLGCHTFILDIPRDEDDLLHTAETFRRAGRLVRA